MRSRRVDFSVSLRLSLYHVLKGYVSGGEWALGEGDALRLEAGDDRTKKGAE